jgi:hypothetical protein
VLKLLRKYKTALMVCFLVFLMVAFLVPQALQQIGKAGPDTIVLTIAGKGISERDAQRAAAEENVLTGLASGVQSARLVGGLLDNRSSRSSEHYLLLREAAARAGLVGGPGEGAAVLSTGGELGEQLRSALARNGLLPRDVDQTLSNANGIVRYVQTYLSAARLSDRRLIAQMRRQFDRATLDLLVISADGSFANSLPAPDEAKLVAHFEKFKDTPPGTGEFGIGYRRPPQVRVAWLKLDRAAIERAVKVGTPEVMKRLMAEVKAKGEALPTDPDTLNARVTATAEKLRKEAADTAMNAAVAVARGQVSAVLYTLADDAGYKAIPTDFSDQRLSIGGLATKMTQSVTLPGESASAPASPFPTPEIGGSDAWFSALEPGFIPVVGNLSLPAADRRAAVPFGALLGMVRELRQPDEAPAPFTIQSRIPFTEPLQDPQGNKYLFVITDARPAAAPASIDEPGVRTQVLVDARRLAAFELLRTGLPGYSVTAAVQGLEGLETEVRSLGLTATMQRDVSINKRESEFLLRPDSPYNAEFVDAVVERMLTLDATKPLDDTPPAERIVAAAIPGKQSVVVGRITRFTPLTVEAFRSQADDMAALEAQRSLDQGRVGREEAEPPFAFQALAKRLNAKDRAGGTLGERREERTKGDAKKSEPGKDGADSQKPAAPAPAAPAPPGP